MLVALTWAAAAEPVWYRNRGTVGESYEASLAQFAAEAQKSKASLVLGPWHVVGPFGNTNGAGFETVYPPENGLDLAAEYQGVGPQVVRWQRVDKFKDGVVNDLQLFSSNQWVCAYVYRTIEAPAALALPVQLGSDDTLTVWLNNEKLLAKKVARGCNLGDEKLTLRLKQGRNHLLLKVCQGTMGWGFAFAADPTAAGPRLGELWPVLRRDFPRHTRGVELLEEAHAQFAMLEAIRSGKRPSSRFATPALTHRGAALIEPTDRDPVDIVLRRTQALLADLRQLPGTRDLSAAAKQLAALSQRNQQVPIADLTARQLLHAQACAVRRQIAFANPLLDFSRILFITHKRNGQGELAGDHMAGQYYGIHATKGEGLFVLENAFGPAPVARLLLTNAVCANGRFAGQALPDGAYLSPDLSFDGRSVLFAYTEAAGYRPKQVAPEDASGLYSYSGLRCSFTEANCWNLYRVNVDGSGLFQVTQGAWNDFDPCWLPNGKIAFISDRRGGFGRCHMTANGGAPWFTYTLHRVNPDGSGMERLSHHETCEWQPSLTHDGMLLYTRWDYVDRGFFQAHHPWLTTPDGRDPRAVHGNYPRHWKDRPCMEMDLRAIPQSRRWVATAAAHHGQTYGSLVLVNPDVADDDAMAPVRLLTPEERFPESEYGYFCREAAYATPWPLSEDYHLCVYGYPGPNGQVDNYAIYLLDSFGNKELVYRNPQIACLSPIPLKARPQPPVIPDQVQPLLVNMQAPRVNTARATSTPAEPVRPQPASTKPATMALMDVYNTQQPWPSTVRIKALRIIQVLPKSTPGRHSPPIGYGTEKNARIVLGTVPVEEDGSAYFQVPPHVPVYFQALDEKGLAVQSMRSATYASPGETLSCVGCHESRHNTPKTSTRTPLALRRAPSVISPAPDGANPFNYMRLVQPVLDKHCVSCHAQKKAPDLSGAAHGTWARSYHSLRSFAFYYAAGDFTSSRTVPMQFGARASRLYKLLTKGHHDVQLPEADLQRLALWLDCNSDFYGAYENLPAQLRGEIVKPSLE